MQAALLAHEDVTILPGTYTINQTIIVPERRRLTGQGVTLIAASSMALVDLFKTPDYAHDVTFRGFAVVGTHTGGYTNGQMSAIAIGRGARNITVEDCSFEKLPGFSVSQRGGSGTRVQRCAFTDCGNGLNVTADGSTFSDNRFVRSEGIETAAANVTAERNTFDPAYACAISIGGDTSKTLPGIVVRGNLIARVVDSAQNGIVVADGCDGALIEANIITGCLNGIVVTKNAAAPGSIVRNTLLRGNLITGVRVGIQIASGVISTTLDGNTITNTEYPVLDYS